ncbi:MAG: hypothetical protein JNL58_23015 [Planctomyces sp.]|nr:hypothetical protein [Planctomyces sp.]
MKKSRRRLALQLTPLLDLLLIVIFAQYMEVQQRAQSAEDELNAGKATLSERERSLEVQIATRQQELTEENNRLRAEYADRFESILDQQQRAGSTLAVALNLPGELIEQLAKLRSTGNTADAERLEQAAARVHSLMESRGREFLQFVTRVDEMQKHVSVWEIHVQDNGQALLTDGQQQSVVGFTTSEEFASRLFESSKQLSEPKILVLVLLTYGDTQAGLRRRATDAMPELIERLRKDAGMTRWYDFSLMGYRPQGPVFSTPSPAEP